MIRFDPPRKSTGVAQLDDLIDQLRRVFDSFQPLAITDEHLVTVSLVAGPDKKVFHGLEQPVRTWSVVRLTGAAIISEGAASTSPKDFLNFQASATCTATIRFS